MPSRAPCRSTRHDNPTQRQCCCYRATHPRSPPAAPRATSCGTGESDSVSCTARNSTVSSISLTAPMAPRPSNTLPAQCNGPIPVQARKKPDAKSSSISTTGAATGDAAAAMAAGVRRAEAYPAGADVADASKACKRNVDRPRSISQLDSQDRPSPRRGSPRMPPPAGRAGQTPSRPQCA